MLQLSRAPRLRLHKPEGRGQGGEAAGVAGGIGESVAGSVGESVGGGVGGEGAAAEGELLEGGKPLGGYFDRHGDFEEDLLHLEVVL